NWNSLAVADGKMTNLTKGLSVSFGIEDHDTPNTPPAYGAAGWYAEDQAVLLYDRYDVWLAQPASGQLRNLTAGLGRKDKIQFRHVRLDPQERAIDPSRPLLLRAENEWTRDTGFYRIQATGSQPEKLLMAAKSFGLPMKAKKAEVLVLTASTFAEY